MGVHVATSKRLIEYILWQLLEERLRAGEGTLSNYLKQMLKKNHRFKDDKQLCPCIDLLTFGTFFIWHLSDSRFG